MPNIPAALKDEITRLVQKEVKNQFGPLKKTVAEQCQSSAALERNQAFLKKQEKRRLIKRPKAAAASSNPPRSGWPPITCVPGRQPRTTPAS